MTRHLSALNLPCGCRVWRFRRRWLPSRVCTAHVERPRPTGIDYLRRRLTEQKVTS